MAGGKVYSAMALSSPAASRFNAIFGVAGYTTPNWAPGETIAEFHFDLDLARGQGPPQR